MALFGLATLSLSLQYAPLRGTRESLFVLAYVVLTYLALGLAAVAFIPRVRVAEAVGGVGVAIAGIFGLGLVYYAIAGSGTLGVYLALILVFAMVVQAGSAGGFVFVGRQVPAAPSPE